jgi:hypothetical protein
MSIQAASAVRSDNSSVRGRYALDLAGRHPLDRRANLATVILARTPRFSTTPPMAGALEDQMPIHLNTGLYAPTCTTWVTNRKGSLAEAISGCKTGCGVGTRGNADGVG